MATVIDKGFIVKGFSQLSELWRAKQKSTRYAGGKKVLYKKHLSHTIELFKPIVIFKRKVFLYGTRVQSLAHTKWLCKYHIVFSPKYRRKIIFANIRETIGEILKDLCKYKGVEIIEGHLIQDHVHMLVSIPPKISVSSFMGYLKGKSSLMVFDRHANLKYKFGNRKFWAEGYFVSTVGLNESTIKKYIQQQEKHDILQDRVSTREYQNPFQG